MVILPYKDRLELFSKYLQQLVMESLGKEHDSDGKLVNQGIVVLGNKGATDQHSYVQQLMDGLNNFFVTFIEVLRDGVGEALMVEPGVEHVFKICERLSANFKIESHKISDNNNMLSKKYVVKRL